MHRNFIDLYVWDNRRAARRMLKKTRLLTRPTLATTSPSRPESAKTASLPKDAPCPKQGCSDLSLYKGWVGEGLSDFPTSPEGAGRLFFTARIERPLFYRGGSASKETMPAASLSPSEAARCASKGIVPATPSPLFQHPARSSRATLGVQGVGMVFSQPQVSQPTHRGPQPIRYIQRTRQTPWPHRTF